MKQIFVADYNIIIPYIESYNDFIEYIKNTLHINNFYIVCNNSIIHEHNFNILQYNETIRIENILYGGRKSYPNIALCSLIVLYPFLVLCTYYILYYFVYKKCKNNFASIKMTFYAFLCYFYIFTSYLYISVYKDSSFFYLLFAIPICIPVLLSIITDKGSFLYTIFYIFCIIGLLVYILIKNNKIPGTFLTIGFIEIFLYALFIFILGKYYKNCGSSYINIVILLCSFFIVPFILQSFIDYTE